MKAVWGAGPKTPSSRLPRHETLLGVSSKAIELGCSTQDAFARPNKGRLSVKPSSGDGGRLGGKHEENERKARTGDQDSGQQNQKTAGRGGGFSGNRIVAGSMLERNRHIEEVKRHADC